MEINTPGRICLFGEHQDYLGLPVIAMAISKFSRLSGTVRNDTKVVISKPDIDDNEKLKEAVDSALKQLNGMRSIEGKQIYKDLMSRIRIIKKDLTSIKNSSDKMPKRKKLLEKTIENDI